MLQENPLTSGMNTHQFSAVTPSNIDVSNFKYKSLEILRNVVREIFSKNHFMVGCTHLGVIIESQYLLNRVLGNPIVNKSDLIDCRPNQCCNLRGPTDQHTNTTRRRRRICWCGIVFSIITPSTVQSSIVTRDSCTSTLSTCTQYLLS